MARVRLSAFFLPLLHVSTVAGAFYTDPAQLYGREYDFIIVGGGTAGLVMADRLSEIPQFKVLVIESGQSQIGNPGVDCPALSGSILNSVLDWNFTTVPQQGLKQRPVNYNRGKMDGGSSGMNVMTFTRASEDDTNLIASITKDDNWSFKHLEPFYKKALGLVAPTSNSNTEGLIDPTDFGHGPINVSLGAFQPQNVLSRVIKSTEELPDEFFFNPRMHNGTVTGTGLVASFIDHHSRRSYAASAHLEPAKDRRNLDVLHGTTATKLIPANKSANDKHHIPTIRTVEVAAGPHAPHFVFSAKKEIILSAGSIGSPQLLLLSGIGNSTVLKKMGISPVIDLPDVGQHLKDQPLVPVYFRVNSNETLDDTLFRNVTLQNAALSQWNETGLGPFSTAPAAAYSFGRLPEDSPIIQDNGFDPSAGKTSPHIENIFLDLFLPTLLPPPASGNFMTIITVGLTPSSSGSVSLNTTNAFDKPLIDPAFLSTDFDRKLLIAGVRRGLKFLSTSAWENYIDAAFDPRASANASDTEILAYLEDMTTTVWHPLGSCRMTAADADPEDGVVDNNLRLKGAKGIRIIDGSIFPDMLAGHPTSMIYTVAERMADVIKKEYHTSPCKLVS